ncbi:putative F-box domain, leucine-rich repeat domain superfamily, F-box-like domain superfamily [Helianthus anomalus]
MDMISKLPSNIIETILCFLPIQEAARTSILSTEWRYHWTKIPKLVFIEEAFQVSTDDDGELSDMGQPYVHPTQRNEMIKRRKLFDAIHQVLSKHEDPIHEFTLSMVTDGSSEIDRILFLLSQKNTVRKLTLEFISVYKLYSTLFFFDRLIDIHLTGCDLDYEPMFDGFRDLASLYLQEVMTSRKALLHILSTCPLLKSVYLDMDHLDFDESDDSTVVNLVECLPMVENLSIGFGIIECFTHDGIPQELPIALVHLKYLCIKDICFIHNYGLPALVLLIKSSPNLEKLKLEILDDSWVEISERRDSFTLKEDLAIWLEHLKELEIVNMIYRNAELDFVKVILAKSPMLKKVKIFLYNEVAKDEALHISGILKQSPHASSVVEFFVEIIGGSGSRSRSVM